MKPIKGKSPFVFLILKKFTLFGILSSGSEIEGLSGTLLVGVPFVLLKRLCVGFGMSKLSSTETISGECLFRRGLSGLESESASSRRNKDQ